MYGNIDFDIEKVDNASSRRKISLTGGKTVHYYFYPTSIQEKLFINLDNDDGLAPSTGLDAIENTNFQNFNPCIYSYIEKSAAVENSTTSVIVSVEVKYYVEFKSSC